MATLHRRPEPDFINRGMPLSQTPLGSVGAINFLRTSDGLNWPHLHASLIEQGPSERGHGGVPDLWIATPLDPTDMSFNIDRDHERKIMPARAVSILAPHTPVAVTVETPNVRAFHISIAAKLLTEVAAELFDCPDKMEIVSAVGTDNRSIALLLNAVMHALQEPLGGAILEIEYLARAIVADVLARHAVQRARPVAIDRGSSLSSHQLQRVLEYVEENLSQALSLDELAGVAGLGRTVFLQRFKRSLRQTPHRYVVAARIRRAQNLLSKSDLSITHIAAICGFADHAHFCTIFRRLLGATPSTYRQESK